MRCVYTVPDRLRSFFYAFALVQIFTIIGLSAYTIDTYTHSSADAQEARTYRAYGTALILTAIAMLYFVTAGVFFEQKWRIIFFIGSAILVFAYALYSFIRNRNNDSDMINKDVRLGRLVVGAVCFPIDMVVGYKVVSDMNWLAYHVAGSDPEKIAAFNWYSRFRSFMDLDLMLAITLVVLAASTEDFFSKKQLALSICGIVLSVVWIAAGTYGSRRESKVLMILFYLLSTLEPMFIFYKYNTFATHWDSLKHQDTTVPILLLGTAAVFLRCIVVGFAIKVHKNFGKGLSEGFVSASVDGKTYGSFGSD